nr:MAG TPA: hypothetical protein [Caudoviricetes sp.]
MKSLYEYLRFHLEFQSKISAARLTRTLDPQGF